MANPLRENLQFLPQRGCKQLDLNTPAAVTMLERSHGSDDGFLGLGLGNQAAGDEESVLSMLCLMDLLQVRAGSQTCQEQGGTGIHPIDLCTLGLHLKYLGVNQREGLVSMHTPSVNAPYPLQSSYGSWVTSSWTFSRVPLLLGSLQSLERMEMFFSIALGEMNREINMDVHFCFPGRYEAQPSQPRRQWHSNFLHIWKHLESQINKENVKSVIFLYL